MLLMTKSPSNMEIYGILPRNDRPNLICPAAKNGWMILTDAECRDLLFSAGIHPFRLPSKCPFPDRRCFIPLGTPIIVTTNKRLSLVYCIPIIFLFLLVISCMS